MPLPSKVGVVRLMASPCSEGAPGHVMQSAHIGGGLPPEGSPHNIASGAARETSRAPIAHATMTLAFPRGHLAYSSASRASRRGTRRCSGGIPIGALALLLHLCGGPEAHLANHGPACVWDLQHLRDLWCPPSSPHQRTVDALANMQGIRGVHVTAPPVGLHTMPTGSASPFVKTDAPAAAAAAATAAAASAFESRFRCPSSELCSTLAQVGGLVPARPCRCAHMVSCSLSQELPLDLRPWRVLVFLCDPGRSLSRPLKIMWMASTSSLGSSWESPGLVGAALPPGSRPPFLGQTTASSVRHNDEGQTALPLKPKWAARRRHTRLAGGAFSTSSAAMASHTLLCGLPTQSSATNSEGRCLSSAQDLAGMQG